MRPTLLPLLLFAILIGCAPRAAPPAAPPPSPGQPAPDFLLEGADREAWDVDLHRRPADWRGRVLVVAFFPAAWSGGCSREFEEFASRKAEFDALGAALVGISGDSKFSLHEWARQTQSPFVFLSDRGHRAAAAWGSLDPESLYSRRNVFVVDPEGIVRYADLDFQEDDPAEYDRLLDAVRGLPRGPSGARSPTETPWETSATNASA